MKTVSWRGKEKEGRNNWEVVQRNKDELREWKDVCEYLGRFCCTK